MKIHSLLKSSIKEILQIVSHKQDKYLKTKDKRRKTKIKA